MSTSSKSSIINGHVDARTAALATAALHRNGLTVSEFIRNSFERIASTSVVPECGYPLARIGSSAENTKDFIRELRNHPMPGRDEYPGLTAEQMADKIRMERYGY